MITELDGLNDMFLRCKGIMEAKNGDYGASWRRMRPEGISDVIANKIDRIRHLEDLERQGLAPQVSEGIDSDIIDIVVYCDFYLIKREERRIEEAKRAPTTVSHLS